MGTVILDGRSGSCSAVPRRDKLAGHLKARLAEYEEDGISSRIDYPGTVCARFDGMSGDEAARRLAEQGVWVCPAGAEVRFVVGPDTSFEDLDYVQSAAAKML